VYNVAWCADSKQHQANLTCYGMVSKGIWHTDKTDVIKKSRLYHSHGSSQISGSWSSCYWFYLVQKVSCYLHISTRHRDWWCISSLAESWYVRYHYLMLLWQTTRMFTSLHEVARHNNGNGIFLLSACWNLNSPLAQTLKWPKVHRHEKRTSSKSERNDRPGTVGDVGHEARKKECFIPILI